MSTPSETIHLFKILSKTICIIKSQVHHFQVLSILFLLPFSLSIIIYPIFLKTIFNSQSVSSSKFPSQILIMNLLYIIFVTILFIYGVSSVSFSTIHALCGTPIDLITSIKSISNSFFPFFFTLITQEFILALISWPFLSQSVQIYVSESVYKSDPYYLVFIMLLTLMFLLALINLQTKWTLVYVIVVLECKWGMEPMQKSAELVKKKKRVAFSMVFLFDLMVGALFLGFYVHGRWGFIFYLITSVVYMTMALLLSLVANVVLYVYCIGMHGEVFAHTPA